MSLKTWTKRVKTYDAGTPITNSLINALVSVFRRSIMVEPKEETMFLEQEVVYDYGNWLHWTITASQTAKGLDWLKRGAIKRKLTEHECGEELLSILDDFDRFTFEGVKLDWIGLRVDAAPVYRVWARDGRYFDYSAVAWQQAPRPPFVVLAVVCPNSTDGREVM
jgi:hypothetical protein